MCVEGPGRIGQLFPRRRHGLLVRRHSAAQRGQSPGSVVDGLRQVPCRGGVDLQFGGEIAHGHLSLNALFVPAPFDAEGQWMTSARGHVDNRPGRAAWSVPASYLGHVPAEANGRLDEIDVKRRCHHQAPSPKAAAMGQLARVGPAGSSTSPW